MTPTSDTNLSLVSHDYASDIIISSSYFGKNEKSALIFK